MRRSIYLTDNEGSVRDIVSWSGAVTDHIDYSGYGVITTESNSSVGDQYKYDGGFSVASLGLERFGGRWYAANTGNWISQDPILFGGGQSNLYQYVGNDPTNATDPSGLIRSTIKLPEYGAQLPGAAKQIVIDSFGDGLNRLDAKDREAYLNGLVAAYIDAKRAQLDIARLIARENLRASGKRVPKDAYLDNIQAKVDKWFGTEFALSPAELAAASVGTYGYAAVIQPFVRKNVTLSQLKVIHRAFQKFTSYIEKGGRLYLSFEAADSLVFPKAEAISAYAKDGTFGILLFPNFTKAGIKGANQPLPSAIRANMYHEILHFSFGIGDPGYLLDYKVPGWYEDRLAKTVKRVTVSQKKLLMNPDTYAGFLLDAYFSNPLQPKGSK